MLTATCARRAKVAHVDGLHVRPCMAIVKAARRYQAQVTICRGTLSVDATSVLDLLSLAATQGTELVVTATGEEAEGALDAVADLLDGTTELAGGH